ncbi:hypothetical protein GCM10022380_36560 [Amycolatopsis tucumanensis]|uniref:Secreted protein n=2 Tax=Amycolatopsis tucumanensis TaxID=401106 RepID=A0ABP7ICQ1_9PSEU
MNNRTVVAIGLGIAAALIVSALLGGWVALVVVVVLFVIIGAAIAATRPRPQPQFAPPVPPQPINGECPVSGERLRSADRDYYFFFSAQVHYQFVPGTGGPDVASWAVQNVRDRASELAGRYQPEDLAQAQQDLAAALAQAAGDSGSRWAWAAQVTLVLSDADRQLVDRRVELRKKVRQWEDELALEKALRAYLRDDALATPSNALIWWLAQHKDRVEEAVRLRGTFALLSSAAHESTVSPFFASYAADAEPAVSEAAQRHFAAEPADRPSSPVELADRFVQAVYPSADDEPQRELLKDRLARLLVTSGRTDLGDALRQNDDDDGQDNVTSLW